MTRKVFPATWRHPFCSVYFHWIFLLQMVQLPADRNFGLLKDTELLIERHISKFYFKN